MDGSILALVGSLGRARRIFWCCSADSFLFPVETHIAQRHPAAAASPRERASEIKYPGLHRLDEGAVQPILDWMVQRLEVIAATEPGVSKGRRGSKVGEWSWCLGLRGGMGRI